MTIIDSWPQPWCYTPYNTYWISQCNANSPAPLSITYILIFLPTWGSTCMPFHYPCWSWTIDCWRQWWFTALRANRLDSRVHVVRRFRVSVTQSKSCTTTSPDCYKQLTPRASPIPPQHTEHHKHLYYQETWCQQLAYKCWVNMSKNIVSNSLVAIIFSLRCFSVV